MNVPIYDKIDHFTNILGEIIFNIWLSSTVIFIKIFMKKILQLLTKIQNLFQNCEILRVKMAAGHVCLCTLFCVDMSNIQLI